MIEKITNKKNLTSILEFFNNFFDYDCYITENNTRIYITDYESILKLFKQSILFYEAKEKGYCQGIVTIWKSLGGDVARYYLKLAALNTSIADKLLTVVLWNFSKDLYVKVRKDNKFISVLKRKGFRFQGGRGSQVLLYRKYIPLRTLNERNTINNRDDDEVHAGRQF